MCHENKFKTKQGQKIDANGTGTDFFSKYNINQKVTLKKKNLINTWEQMFQQNFTTKALKLNLPVPHNIGKNVGPIVS